jgi:hypothetical protein
MRGMVDAQYCYLDWLIENVLMSDSAIPPSSTGWGPLEGITQLANTPIPAGTLYELQPGIRSPREWPGLGPKLVREADAMPD